MKSQSMKTQGTETITVVSRRGFLGGVFSAGAFILSSRLLPVNALAADADEILRAAKGADRNLIESVTVFDVYEGKGVPEGKKSLAISARIQPRDRTLTDPEIEALGQKLVAAVTKATGAVLRS